jgi:hypothetical protein
MYKNGLAIARPFLFYVMYTIVCIYNSNTGNIL